MANLFDFDYEYYVSACKSKVQENISKNVKVISEHVITENLDFVKLAAILNRAMTDMIRTGLLTLDDEHRKGLMRIRDAAVQKANDSVKEKITNNKITVGEANKYMKVYLEQFKESLELVKYELQYPKQKLR